MRRVLRKFVPIYLKRHGKARRCRLIQNAFVAIILETPMTSSRSLLALVALLAVLWCAGIVAAPLLKNAGAVAAADGLYDFYGRICHQLDSHSWHLGGDKFAVCVRCSSIYFSFAVSLLAWMVAARRRGLLPLRPALVIAAAGLMVIDVALHMCGLHASSTVTRMLTGGLLGGILPWVVVPLFLEAVGQMRRRRPRPTERPSGEMQHA